MKRHRYGLKIFNVVDPASHYMINATPYLGKEQKGKAKKVIKKAPLSERVVLELMEGLFDAGRTLTVDNYFTSTSLAEALYGRKTYLLGTIRRNNTGVPKDFVSEKSSTGKAKFLFSGHLTLMKYTPKPRKAVFLLSSKHHQAEVTEKTVRGRSITKPAMVHEYNKMKSGIDVLDAIRSKHTCSRESRR